MENKKNEGQGLAVASLAIGIFSFLLSLIPCVNLMAVVIGALAVIFGIVAITKTDKSKQTQNMGIAGISLGGVAMIIVFIMFGFLINSKSIFNDKIDTIFDWVDDFEEHVSYEDNGDIVIDSAARETLDNLEEALDELEGITVDTSEEKLEEKEEDVLEE